MRPLKEGISYQYLNTLLNIGKLFVNGGVAMIKSFISLISEFQIDQAYVRTRIIYLAKRHSLGRFYNVAWSAKQNKCWCNDSGIYSEEGQMTKLKNKGKVLSTNSCWSKKWIWPYGQGILDQRKLTEGKVSLFSWPRVYFVWIQLLC